MSLPTWRPGSTPNPGFVFEYADGTAVPHADILEVLAFFSVGEVELAKHSKTDRTVDGFIIATEVVANAGEYRFPIDHTVTDAWPEKGKVRMVVKVKTTSLTFGQGARTIFDEIVAVLGDGETTEV